MQGVCAMLNLEYLLEEAKNNGLPIIKKRGVLREYVQIIILNSIYKHNLGKRLFFTGGTALRYFYAMPRFSEDLDFDTADLTYGDFVKLLESIKKDLHREGFSSAVVHEHRKKLFIAEINFKDLMRLFNVADMRGLNLMIKIEVYKPSWQLHCEAGVISLYGYNFSSVLLDKGDMFAEKLSALFNRKRGRDIYDTLFMLKKKFPINKKILVNKIKGFSKDSILKHLKSLPKKELVFLANQIKPFLFKEDDIDLVLNASLYAEQFLKAYKNKGDDPHLFD